MRITDAQVHIWDRVAIPEAVHRVPALGANELRELMNGAGVNRAILVPPSWANDGNEVALSAASNWPDQFAVMGILDLKNSGGAQPVHSWMAQKGMLGARVALFTKQHRASVVDGSLDWLWGGAEEASVPLMIYPPRLLSEIRKIVVRHKKLKIIIDHCGAPARGGLEDLHAAVDELGKLSDCENVAVKISNLPIYSESNYPFSDVQAVMLTVLKAFGSDRVFWGSDFTRTICSYRESVTMMTEDFEGLDVDALRTVMGEGICTWLRWN